MEERGCGAAAGTYKGVDFPCFRAPRIHLDEFHGIHREPKNILPKGNALNKFVPVQRGGKVPKRKGNKRPCRIQGGRTAGEVAPCGAPAIFKKNTGSQIFFITPQ